tara:strand:+ start:13975 stop:14130 length:156 start_codon:yes stop_codon:yes gene_type:complete
MLKIGQLKGGIMTAKEHPMYNTYLYWKKNKETIKQRIENTFDLKHKLYRDV